MNRKLFIDRVKAFVVFSLFLVSTPVFSQQEPDLQTNMENLEELVPARPGAFDSSAYVEAGYTFDSLTNNYANWNSEYLNVFLPLHQNGLVNVQLQNANRYGQNDQDINIIYAYPFSYGILNLYGGTSPNGHFLPQTTFGAEWDGRLPQSFGYILGANQKQFSSFYSNASTNAYSLGLEKYIGDFRFAYVGTVSSINRDVGSYASKVQAQWIGPTNNRLGITYAGGMEPTVVSLNNLVPIQFSYVQIDALYWLTNTVGVTAALWHGNEASYYQRNGGQLGLRFNF
jgi:YaiO family outer membrane protein